MDPINYLGMLPQVDLGRQFLSGLQAGSGIGEIQQQADARQLALQQKQIAMQRAAQYQADVGAALSAPMDQQPQLFAALALRNPEQYEAINKSFGALSADQQKNELRDTYSIASTLQSGRPDLALQQIDDRITAHKNSGQPTADLEALRAQVEKDPKGAYGQVLHIVSGLPGGDSVLKSLQGMNEDARKQAESDATVAGKLSDNELKNLGIVGQTAGALAKPGVKPAQVATMFKSLEARGIIPKGGAQGYIDNMPTDPAALPDYLKQVQTAGMKPDEQMKFTTPDANAKLSAETQIRTTGMNNATSLAVAKENSNAGDKEASLDPDTLTAMAQQYLAGDKSVMQNLGRGAQGAANIVALRQEITKQAKAQGMTGSQIAATMADYVGTLAGQRTAGTRIANVEMASDEAQRLIPLAKQASADVARSGFLPFGRAQNMFDDQTNDPALRKFAAANNALVNVYSRAISPGGVATVSDKEHARHMLSTAMDHKSYLAVLDQMQREIQAAREAPQAVRGAFRDRVTGSTPATAPTLPAGWSVEVH